ncbi:hypothetical protein [Burkholderia sp. BDU5]|uniref:hypothetical protein n=1 Tax=Burkholderia sp. BDU5 TaxID=1385590 RepID=UPI001E3ADB63|nr:hypothetical protein [Burkholderia sp. BDU5]
MTRASFFGRRSLAALLAAALAAASVFATPAARAEGRIRIAEQFGSLSAVERRA